jgi:Ca2+-binding EF-hand superfamily protein
MSRVIPIQLSMEYDFKRFSAIQKEFKSIDKENKGFLSLGEIFEHIEQTKNKEIPEELKRELTQILDAGHQDTPIAM